MNIRHCAVAGIALMFAHAALAVTDFTDTFTPANVAAPGNWTEEDATGDNGAGNRLGGATNPQVGLDGAIPVFSMSGQNGQYIDYNYAAGGAGGLSGSYFASLDATFRPRNVNNGNLEGTPVLSLSLGNNVGVSLNVAQNPDDTYHYKLLEFDANGNRNILLDVFQFAVDATTDHQDFNYQRFVLSLDVTGRATLAFNGSTVFDQVLAPFGPVESRAWFGAGTAVQPLPGNAFDHVWFQSVTLTASSVPEPATLGLLALGSVGLLRRRRSA
jgi:hypothetical protein